MHRRLAPEAWSTFLTAFHLAALSVRENLDGYGPEIDYMVPFTWT